MSVCVCPRVFACARAALLALVCLSCGWGLCAGLLIAISLTLQFNLFLEMPFHFEFPTLIFCVVLSSILGPLLTLPLLWCSVCDYVHVCLCVPVCSCVCVAQLWQSSPACCRCASSPRSALPTW